MGIYTISANVFQRERQTTAIENDRGALKDSFLQLSPDAPRSVSWKTTQNEKGREMCQMGGILVIRIIYLRRCVPWNRKRP